MSGGLIFLKFGKGPGAAAGGGSNPAVLLDDFATLRTNANASGSPSGKIFSCYLGEDPNQVGSLGTSYFRSTTGSGDSCYIHFHPLNPDYQYSAGYAQGWIKSGSWSSSINRLCFMFRPSRNRTGDPASAGDIQFGTYIRDHADSDGVNQGAHYYHFLYGNFTANKWHKVVLNATPQHQVGGSGSTNWGNDPEFGGAENVHYMDGLTRFYFDAQYISTAGDTWDMSDFYFDTAAQAEDEAELSNLMAVYDGAKYVLTFNTIKNAARTINFRYSTSDMHSGGFSSGTAGTGTTSQNSDYCGAQVATPNMAESATGMYLAIQRSSGTAQFAQIYVPYQMAPGSIGPV